MQKCQWDIFTVYEDIFVILTFVCKSLKKLSSENSYAKAKSVKDFFKLSS